MKKSTLCTILLLALLSLNGTALAQLKFGTAFSTSDALWSVTHVKVKSNMTPYYPGGDQTNLDHRE